ncbi:Dual-action HEIGH metallo-peptidase [candidate division SR1 bacterium Aalborg_AAW-1]|nr:Dual-action HEIGH metallo-peptidase [candidate division SR1 bacterium Aalborg_AAW-1]
MKNTRTNNKFINNSKTKFMKKTFLRTAIIILLFVLPLSLVTSCYNDDENNRQLEEIITNQELAISDPQIKKEIDYMRDNKIISDSTYKRWLQYSKDRIFFQENPEITNTNHEEYYMIPPYKHTNSSYDYESISRTDLQKLIESNPNAQSRMKRQAHMYDSSGGTITCRVITSGTAGLNTEWKNALKQALAVWNARGLKVKFKIVDATNTNIVGGYINVYMANLNDSFAFAWTEPIKSPGYFSEKIVINNSANPAADVNAKKYALIHEIGHAVGFMHTDSSVNSTTIFNTGSTCNEWFNFNSFMYSGMSSTTTFSDFTSCDKENLNYYWGYGLLA